MQLVPDHLRYSGGIVGEVELVLMAHFEANNAAYRIHTYISFFYMEKRQKKKQLAMTADEARCVEKKNNATQFSSPYLDFFPF